MAVTELSPEPPPRGGEAGAALVLRLFGPMEVRLGARPLPRLRSRKGLWLLALLALRGGRNVDRDWLAATLWPDCEELQGLRSLRQSLYDLRRALGAEARRLVAEGTRRAAGLDLAGAFVDVLAFDAAIAPRRPGTPAATPDRWRRRCSSTAGPCWRTVPRSGAWRRAGPASRPISRRSPPWRSTLPLAVTRARRPTTSAWRWEPSRSARSCSSG